MSDLFTTLYVFYHLGNSVPLQECRQASSVQRRSMGHSSRLSGTSQMKRVNKINLLRVIIRLFNQFVSGRLKLRPRAPALCSGLACPRSRRGARHRVDIQRICSPASSM
ncbi:hypothetical protein PAEPH01_0631 [Pancytospora epiphaga]|nr:hypothetical protein PAEPH01_0631 [Pancytospora epiphaga]